LPATLQTVYTRLPAGLPDEITRLARTVASGVGTDLEKAVLLETFFRDPANGFVYDLSTSGHDSPSMADWLTDPANPLYRRGWCEQYAAAMALMARAVGVPARVVVGFAPGQEVGPGRVEVQRRHAHAWVETWLAGGGWTRFDPTPQAGGPASTSSQLDFDPRQFVPSATAPSIPVIGETGEQPQPEPDRGPTAPVQDDVVGGLHLSPGPVLLAVLGLTAIAAAVPGWKWARRAARRRRWRQGDSAAAWRELSDRLQDLGAPRPPSETMVEYATRLDPAYAAVAHRAGAAFYGGKVGLGLTPAMDRAEARLRQAYPPARRLRAWLSLRSMRRAGARPPGAPR
jgi:hypothetical protein